jgi:hypothetical protein
MQELLKKTDKKQTSAWHAFGCGCGLIGVIGILVVFTFIFFEYAKSYKNPRWNRDDFAECQQRMLSLKTGIENYRKDNKEKNPKKLSDLKPKYLIDDKALICPRFGQNDTEQYIYSPDSYTADEELIICRNHAQRIVILQGNLQLRLRLKEKTYGIDPRDK